MNSNNNALHKEDSCQHKIHNFYGLLTQFSCSVHGEAMTTFTDTVTHLSAEYMARLPEDELAKILDEVGNQTKVEIIRQQQTCTFSGQWISVLSAYRILEQILAEEPARHEDCLETQTVVCSPMSEDIDDAHDLDDCGVVCKQSNSEGGESSKTTVAASVKHENYDEKMDCIDGDLESPAVNNQTIMDCCEIKLEDSSGSDTDVYDDEEIEKERLLSADKEVSKTNGEDRQEEIESEKNHKFYDQRIRLSSFEDEEGKERSSGKITKDDFHCEYCKYSGKDMKTFNEHVKRKHGDKCLTCDKCDKKFSLTKDQRRHKKRAHPEKLHYCNHCDKFYKTERAYKCHMLKHDISYVKPSFECNICSKSCSSKYTLSGHMRSEHLGEDIKRIASADKEAGISNSMDRQQTEFEGNCEKVGDQMVQLSSFSGEKGQVRRLGKNTKEDFHCEYCKYSGKDKMTFNEHVKRKHGDMCLTCDKCDKKFSLAKDQRRHKKRAHPEKLHYCNHCDKFYKSARTYECHMATHDVSFVKPSFECNICSKSYSAKPTLSAHMRSEHLGEQKKLHVCEFCGQTFTTLKVYREHVNVHKGVKPYICEICGMAFAYTTSLKRHRELHDDTKRFTCDVCQNTFRQMAGLRLHMKIHQTTIAKDYRCSHCGKGFTQPHSLKRHERIHNGEKPFSCSRCGQRFRDDSIARRHMIMIHKQDAKKWRSLLLSDLERHPRYIRQITDDNALDDAKINPE